MKIVKKILIAIIKPYNWRWFSLQRITVGPLYYWLWQLYSLVVTCVFFYGFNAYILFVGNKYPDVDEWIIAFIIGLLFIALYLYHFIVSIGMTYKRLNNAGLSYWNFLWILVPCIGIFALMIMLCYPSKFFNR
ncbi:MAG: DUF805 domain-containing protein [Bacteroidaceae bacterium]|nr:DUF805 domain-containing protein [Bacteroidaceae bacterium]